MEPLYPLAFLLAANDQIAEQCFMSILENGPKENIFKDSILAWIKRSMIQAAIRRVFDPPRVGRQDRQFGIKQSNPVRSRSYRS
jgi:hypothetical protein